MAFNLTSSRKSIRPFVTINRYYSEKSIYQKHEEGEKPRIVHGETITEWRKPWIKRQGEWNTKLSLFIERNPSPDLLYMFSQIPQLSFKKINSWWGDMKILQEIENQKYLIERVASLGANLAAVHFFVYRNCAVRLKGSNDWIKGNLLNIDLPTQYTDGYQVEAIDCSGFHHNGIRFEGLENLKNLSFLKWLSLKNNKHVDVWCMDRIAGFAGKNLEYLDISGCQLTTGCIFALARMRALKMLVVTDPGNDVAMQAALSMLEEEHPNLAINAIDPPKIEQKTNI